MSSEDELDSRFSSPTIFIRVRSHNPVLTLRDLSAFFPPVLDVRGALAWP